MIECRKSLISKLPLLCLLSIMVASCQSTSDAEQRSRAARRAYNERLDALCGRLPEVQKRVCASKVPED